VEIDRQRHLLIIQSRHGFESSRAEFQVGVNSNSTSRVHWRIQLVLDLQDGKG